MSAYLCMMLGAFPSEIPDEYFENTVLLLHGDGTNGAQNNTFLDSSSNNFTITRNGNATQGTFSPFSKEDGKWGNYFDGSGDYHTIAASTAWVFAGDFCLEAFIFVNTLASDQHIFGTAGAGQPDQFNIGGGLLYWNGNGASGLSAGQWLHVCTTRSGTTQRTFINGVLRGYWTGQSSSVGQNATTYIGRRSDGTNSFNGSISNLRIINGSIPTSYQTSETVTGTTVFTPPTGALTTTSQGTTSGDVKLITCQSNRFKDNSSNAFTITPNGNVSVTPFSPFANSASYNPLVNGGSGYFDGSGDYATYTEGSSNPPTPLNWLDGASETGSLEFWIYPKSVRSGSFNVYEYTTIISMGGVYFSVELYQDKKIRFYWYTGGTNYQDTSTAVNLYEWSHIGIVRNGTTVKMYINAIEVASFTYNGLSWGSGSQGTLMAIGAALESTTGIKTGTDFDGYISGVRTSTTARTISVPTAPYSSDGNTSLLLNFTNAAIYDQTGTCDLETVGNAQISTSVKKYGTGSMAFDGSGDGIQFGPSDSLVLGTGDFTIEFWLYMNAQTGTYDSLVDTRWSSGTGFAINSYNNSINYYNGSYQLSRPRSLNTWHHVALVRSNGVSKLYVDGDAGASTYSDAGNYNTTVWQIGRYYGPSDYLNGYIDDLRISRYARYTANFTPPTAAFPDHG